MMARSRSRATDYAVYLAVRAGVALIQVLPDGAARFAAEAFGWLTYLLDRRHRDVADENLRFAFPHLTAERRVRLVRDSFFHFAGLIFEVARLPRKLHANNWRRHVELVGGDRLVAALIGDRPALLVTGHFGNWELAGYALGLLGFRTHAVARPIDNPYVDRFLRQWRERTGQRVLAKKGDFERMEGLLLRGGILATLADQDAGARGPFVNFFGRPASTHKAIALMALEFNVPIVVAGVPRVGRPSCYHVEIEDVIEPAEYAGRPDAVLALTQRYTSGLEILIRRNPGQYFWLHRRWKHQPMARKKPAAA
jgi:KDO2-lipid IV(A) lauroyltransferase